MQKAGGAEGGWGRRRVGQKAGDAEGAEGG